MPRTLRTVRVLAGAAIFMIGVFTSQDVGTILVHVLPGGAILAWAIYGSMPSWSEDPIKRLQQHDQAARLLSFYLLYLGFTLVAPVSGHARALLCIVMVMCISTHLVHLDDINKTSSTCLRQILRDFRFPSAPIVVPAPRS